MIFGTPSPSIQAARYHIRQVVVGIAADGPYIACVYVQRGTHNFLEMPGGGVEPGESEEVALTREFAEETGLIVRPQVRLGESGQYYRSSDGRFVMKYGAHWAVDIIGTGVSREPNHRLCWLKPEKAIARLRHDSQAFVVQTWLRWPERMRKHYRPVDPESPFRRGPRTPTFESPTPPVPPTSPPP